MWIWLTLWSKQDRCWMAQQSTKPNEMGLVDGSKRASHTGFTYYANCCKDGFFFFADPASCMNMVFAAPHGDWVSRPDPALPPQPYALAPQVEVNTHLEIIILILSTPIGREVWWRNVNPSWKVWLWRWIVLGSRIRRHDFPSTSCFGGASTSADSDLPSRGSKWACFQSHLWNWWNGPDVAFCFASSLARSRTFGVHGLIFSSRVEIFTRLTG